MKEENLLYEKDKRILRVNNEISEIFGVPLSVNDSYDPKDRNGFNMMTYQNGINYALNNNKC